MRDLILKMSVSIDGFVAGPDGGIKWVFGKDQEAKAWSVEAVSNASLHIMGSRTFHDMAAYWPTSTDIFALPMNQIPKAVFSKQGPAILKAAGATASWAQAYVASGDLAEEIAKLKAQDGKPIMAHGGAGFARSLIAHDLVDRYVLLVHPVVLGKGLPIFSDLATPRRLKLISSRAFPGGAVAQIYRPATEEE
jgi:dihydrofolate reductase